MKKTIKKFKGFKVSKLTFKKSNFKISKIKKIKS